MKRILIYDAIKSVELLVVETKNVYEIFSFLRHTHTPII